MSNHTIARIPAAGAPQRRHRSAKENAAGWRGFLQAMSTLAAEPLSLQLYEALTASELDDVEEAPDFHELLMSMSDDDLDAIEAALQASTAFDQPADKSTAFTSLSFRLRKAAEASGYIMAARMRRVIEAGMQEQQASTAPPIPARSRRTGL